MEEYNKILNEAKESIDTIYQKYASDSYMLNKAHNYVTCQLPTVFENMRQTYEQRQQRIETMTQDQDTFIESFLNNNQYFYVQQTETFFYYDGIHYQTISEDDILYNVLSSISKDRILMSWKQRTRINIMKRIRENNNLLKSIPESDTIQYVLDSLCPTLFSTRNECKYFLTILGDNILRKNTSLVHYISTKSKQFIRELNNYCQLLIGVNLSQTFKHKYHDHSYSDCRLIKINDCVKIDTVWCQIIHQSVLDIICVACHYSVRYGSSDNFVLYSSNDIMLSNNVFFLKDKNSEDLINSFIEEFMEIPIDSITKSPILPNASTNITIDISANRTPQITWKNMQYLWKQFLESKNLPSIMFLNTLKVILIEKFSPVYNIELDSFIGICSKQLPSIQKFIYFWNDTIVLDETETDFEIEEMIKLFKLWCDIHGEIPSNLIDKQILDLIIYFFPNIEIDRDKYISGVRCSLWDKQMDIQVALDNLKELYRNRYNNLVPTIERRSSPSPNKNISIYDAYIHYCKYHSNTNELDNVSQTLINSKMEKKMIVSKSYFEKYIFENLEEYVIDSKFLLAEWYLL